MQISNTIEWLLESPEPAVRRLIMLDLLERQPDDPQVLAEEELLMQGAWVQGLFAGQDEDGGFGVHPYHKWSGAHWRLVSLVELGLPPGEQRALAAAEQVLDWLTSEEHRRRIQEINGRTRRCASMEGNALAVCSRLGLVQDPRVIYLAQSLISWQWPDGGWNCDKHPQANHSSFYETLSPMWGLVEYSRASGDPVSLAAAQRASQIFLQRSLFRSLTSGEVIYPDWLKLHYPVYWHYDILQALLILSRLAQLSGEPILAGSQVQEALDVLESKRRPDGCWRAGGSYWRPVGADQDQSDVIDWGRRGPNIMITLNTLRVLKLAGRVQ